jgi:hypothetical protein
MRTTALIVTALVILMSAPAAAQEWEDYVNTQDGFHVNFPGKPRITEITVKSQMEYVLPARVYSVEKGRERYSVTVVDYTTLEQQGIERAKTCPPGNAQCRQNAGIMGPGYWMHDMRGAVMFATSQLVKRDAKVTGLGWEWQEMVEGNFVQLTNTDQSRTFAWVTMHEKKLYILEGTVPAGAPEPGLFQQSWSFVDANGNTIRYQQVIYSNAYHGMGVYPKPTYGNQGRGAGGGNAAPGGRGRGAGAGAGAGAPNQ